MITRPSREGVVVTGLQRTGRSDLAVAARSCTRSSVTRRIVSALFVQMGMAKVVSRLYMPTQNGVVAILQLAPFHTSLTGSGSPPWPEFV